jgi:phage/plasmid-associated DNA primase
MAKANAIRQSTGEGDGPKVSMLGDSGRTESQALMDKWGREDQVREMMQEMGRNPKAAGAIANLMHTQQGSETAREELQNRRLIAGDETETRRMGLDVAVRGQDVEAQTRAAQLAGNPLDNAMKQTQIDLGRQAVSKGQEYEKMAADIRAEADPAKRQSMIENLLATQGKNPAENRYVKVDGGEEIGPDGMTKIRRPSGVFDSVTKQFIPMTPNAQSFTKADVDKAISSGADRKAVAERIKQMGGNPADYGLV